MASCEAKWFMKRAIAAVAIAGVLVLLWQVWARHEERREEARVAQAKRDAAYEDVLTQVRMEVPIGLLRSRFKHYLDSQGIAYATYGNGDISEKIGEEPGEGLVCNGWYVYVNFHFPRAQGQTEPSEVDPLSSIVIKKIGHCL
jgi:hypothetical protein